jgi:acyl dehydratase
VGEDFPHLASQPQWIHTDSERAKDGPFGTAITHGLLTLSLGPRHAKQVHRIGAVISSVTEVKGGVQIAITFTWEIEGGTKPACVADMLIRALGS